MNILITGSDGFIAKNLLAVLNRHENDHLFLINRNSSFNELDVAIKQADFIIHLAGINRPQTTREFYTGNTHFTQTIIDLLEKHKRNTPILLTSSTQVNKHNDYAKSKLAAEQKVLAYADKNKAPVFIYRLPNVFGKWCQPHYNSVIATWCYNITHDRAIQINDPNTKLSLVYIDDVVESMIDCLNQQSPDNRFMTIKVVYEKTLGEINVLLTQFKQNRESLLIPRVGSGFERALYATYLSYLPVDKFSYSLQGHSDERGAFYEILKTLDSGQFSISTTKPGMTRGNHYHHTKNEKFLVIKGQALIELRNLLNNKIIQYNVSDKKMEVVEMITGYTHNITNTGETEMVFLIWANETFDPVRPDTYFLKV